MPRKHIPYAVRLAGFRDRPDDCWYLPNKPGKYGYVLVFFRGKTTHAHRAVYEEMVGPIPYGLQLDHLCRNRACVNPRHVEPVTSKENHRRALPYRPSRRQAACNRGHPYVEASFRWHNRGKHMERVCLACEHERNETKGAFVQPYHGGLTHPKGSTHCRHGHEYTAENTIWRKSGGRKCRECKNTQTLASYHRRNAA